MDQDIQFQKDLRMLRLLIAYIDLTSEEEQVNQPQPIVIQQADDTTLHNNIVGNEDSNRDSTVRDILHLMTGRDVQTQSAMNEVIQQTPPQLTELVQRQPIEFEIVLESDHSVQSNQHDNEYFQNNQFSNSNSQFEGFQQMQKEEKKKKLKQRKMQQLQSWQIKQQQQEEEESQQQQSQEKNHEQQQRVEKQIVFNAQQKISKSKLQGQYPCLTCDKLFTYRSSLLRHQKQFHKYVPKRFTKKKNE